ncbi:DUF1203 domain-containing protein [Glacieibacterium sp.]|uniref:DUF1203 domain-containing protein n=1 Tax=Glacieibacterium sp. TaxID=2860237 RepID=UPI003AFFD01B
MSFQIIALDPAPFAPLFGLSDAELAGRHIVRRVADTMPGFPCRVSLADAAIGETLLLLNHEHLPVASPYRAAHAIYVREGAAQAHPEPGEVPEVIARRLISARGYDEAGLMTGADLATGAEVAVLIERLFADPATSYIHLHNARPGCFAARVERA